MDKTNSKPKVSRSDRIHGAALLMMVSAAIGLYFAAREQVLYLMIVLLAIFVIANLLEFFNK